MAARLHYALASIEDAILTDVETEVKKINTVVVNTLLFDGLILYVHTEAEAKVTSVLGAVAERWTPTAVVA